MTETVSSLCKMLVDAKYSVGSLKAGGVEATIFENDSVLGFVVYYDDAATLLKDWHSVSTRVLQDAQFALRKAEKKAWNTYFIFLAEAPPDYAQTIQLGGVEENLIGTRKIARAGVSNPNELRAALLPLLPVRSAPSLEAVDMPEELRLRTSELPSGLVDAFISGTSDATLIQLLEGSS